MAEKKGGWIFQKQPQRIYLTEGEWREGESQETFWMWRQICAHGTALHPCYFSLPPDKQQFTAAGCCLSLMATILQISGCGQVQSFRLLGLDSEYMFHNREISLNVCHYIPFEATGHSGNKTPFFLILRDEKPV